MANLSYGDGAYGSGGGGGSPSAQFLTLQLDPTLDVERKFVPSTGLTAVDGGANGNYTLTVDLNAAAGYSSTRTLASAAGSVYDAIKHAASTVTLTGGTGITTATGFNTASIYQSTLTSTSATAITSAAGLYVENPLAAGAGPVTITNNHAIWGMSKTALTNLTADTMRLEHTTSGTPAANFGVSILFRGQDASKTADGDDVLRLRGYWATATNGSEASKFGIGLRALGAALPAVGSDQLILDGNGTLDTVGNVNAALYIRQTNASTGNASISSLTATAAFAFNVAAYSSGYGTTGFLKANGCSLDTNASAGISIAAWGAAGSITLYCGGVSGLVASFEANTDMVMGKKAAKVTTATTGHFYIPNTAGAPTGVPTGYTGMTAFQYDTTNNKLWAYNGAWRGIVVV